MDDWRGGDSSKRKLLELKEVHWFSIWSISWLSFQRKEFHDTAIRNHYLVQKYGITGDPAPLADLQKSNKQEAIDIFNEMTNRGIAPNVVTLTILLNVYARALSSKQAESIILDFLKVVNVTFRLKIFWPLFQPMASNQMKRRMKWWYQWYDLFNMSVPCFDILWKYSRIRAHGRAISMLDEMKRKGLPPTSQVSKFNIFFTLFWNS